MPSEAGGRTKSKAEKKQGIKHQRSLMNLSTHLLIQCRTREEWYGFIGPMRVAELMLAFAARRLEPKNMRFVYPYPATNRNDQFGVDRGGKERR